MIVEIYRKLDNWLKLCTSRGVWLNYKVNQTSCRFWLNFHSFLMELSKNHRGNRSFRNNLKEENNQQKQ